jgi:hypothetical protein
MALTRFTAVLRALPRKVFRIQFIVYAKCITVDNCCLISFYTSGPYH